MSSVPDESLQDRFIHLLPTLHRHAEFAFRNIFCRETRLDRIAESVAIAWGAFLRLVDRGVDPARFPAVFALRCVQAVRAGRRLAGCTRGADVLSAAERRPGIRIASLSPDGAFATGPAGETLVPSVNRSPASQAAFRIDFAAWRQRFRRRDRQVIDLLARGERTSDVARRHGVSAARISQRRREFLVDWRCFHRDAVEA